MDAKSEELKEKMTELMQSDPTLDPSMVIDKVLNDYTDRMEGPMKAQLISVCLKCHTLQLIYSVEYT